GRAGPDGQLRLKRKKKPQTPQIPAFASLETGCGAGDEARSEMASSALRRSLPRRLLTSDPSSAAASFFRRSFLS
uniref:Uncharacterized protein n=1 Tax=Aegilops tauschii subsp. strangulata TaxID=200361 RepID=A0A452YK10_AEGTS